MLHGAVVLLCEQEPDAGFTDAAFDRVHRGVEVDAQGGEHVRRPRPRGHGAVAVLGDRHAAGRHNKSRGGRNIIGARRVAAGAAGIHRAFGRGDFQHFGAHDAGGAGQFRNTFAAHAQRHQEGADLCRAYGSGHDRLERRFRVGVSQRPAVGQLNQRLLEIGHAARGLGTSPAAKPEASRKLRSN